MSDASRDRGFGKASRDDLVPAEELKSAPKPIQKANATALRLFDTLDEISRELNAATVEARGAEAVDAEALKAALTAGKDEPEPTVAAKAARAKHLKAKRQAAIEARDEAVDQLHRAIAEHQAKWEADELAALTELVEQASPAFESLAEVSQRIDRKAGLVRALHDFDPFSRDADARRTRLTSPGIGGSPEKTLAALAAAIREAPATVSAGPTALERRARKQADKQENKRRRAEHLKARRKAAGTFKWFQRA